MPADGTRTIEHEHVWTMGDILGLTIPSSSDLTVREYLVALTSQEAMREQLPDWSEHVSAFDADCDAVVQHFIREDGELCARVWVRLLAFEPDGEA